MSLELKWVINHKEKDCRNVLFGFLMENSNVWSALRLFMSV